MGKTVRFDEWDDVEEYDRKAVKASRKNARREQRRNKESFIDNGLKEDEE